MQLWLPVDQHNASQRVPLVDELLLTIEPIILGGGKTIFPANGKALPFDLVSTEKASTGAQVCRYVRAR